MLAEKKKPGTKPKGMVRIEWSADFAYAIGLVASASKVFIEWIRDEIKVRLGVFGHLTNDKDATCFQLKYAKADSLILINAMYINGSRCLSRKRLKIEEILCIIGQSIESIGQ